MDRRECVAGLAAVAATAAIPAVPATAAGAVVPAPLTPAQAALVRAVTGDAPLPLASLEDAHTIFLRCYLQAFDLTIRHTENGPMIVSRADVLD
jgi:hypothetical protein